MNEDWKKEQLKNKVKEKLRELFITLVNPAKPILTDYSTPERVGSDNQLLDNNPLTFEQQMELLKLQNEQRRWEAAEHDRMRERELAFQEKRFEVEIEKLRQQERQEEREDALKRERLRLIADGKIQDGGTGSSGGMGAEGNLSHMI